VSREAGETDRQRELLSHVFHLISQPITAVQCSLEFALNTVEDPQQCRSWLEAALENSERLRCRLSLAREMAEVGDAGGATQPVELRAVLEEALSEIEQFFSAGETAIHLRCEAVEVCGERDRLLRAFCYLLQHLSASDAAPSYRPEICVERQAELIEVRFLRFVLRTGATQDQIRSRLEIAKDTFESAGGGLIFFCFAGNDAMVRAFLRAPQTQLDLYSEAGKKPAMTVIGTPAAFPQVS